MTTIEYDIDLSGGLMEEIHRLVAPPQIDDKTRRLRVKERIVCRKPGKIPNHDCCDSCKEGGDLLCCDKCSAAFHLQCHDPPLEEDDVPPGEWLCHYCRTKPLIEDDDTGSTCSSKSRHSDAGPPATNKSRLTTGAPSARRLRGAGGEGGPGGEGGEYGDMLDLSEVTEEEQLNPLRLLARATKVLNPRQFELPKDVVCPINFPGSSKVGSLKRKPTRGDGGRGVPTKRNVIELDKGLVPLPAKLCFMCNRSCRVAALMQCDYCPLVFHLDCLNPPLTAPPYGRWMCPNHVEHALDELLLKSVQLTERIRLWDRYTGPIDPHAVKLQFLNKVHRTNPSFRVKLQHAQRPLTKVPEAIRAMYAARSYSSGPRYSTCQSNEDQQNTEPASVHNMVSHAMTTLYSSTLHSLPPSSDPNKPNPAPAANLNGIVDDPADSLTPEPIRTGAVPLSAPPETLAGEAELAGIVVSSPPYEDPELDSQPDEEEDWTETDIIPFNVGMSEPVVEGADVSFEAEEGCVRKTLRSHKQLADKQAIVESAKNGFGSNNFSGHSVEEEYWSRYAPRALLCPVLVTDPPYSPTPSPLPPVPMLYRSLTIGTGVDMDVCLEEFGHCNNASAKHACIFYDELSGQYELLNYSGHGTTVNDVLYSCDISAKSSVPFQRPATKSVNNVRNLIEATRPFERNCEGGVDEGNGRSRGGQGEEERKDGLALMSSRWCGCAARRGAAMDGTAGWEGSAVLHHGAHVRIGCLSFVFCIVAQAADTDL